MEDEGLILSNQLLALQAVDDWHALGVDVVRIHARWWEIAPQGTKKPAGFNANNPNDPQYKFANLDNAVAIVRNAGINVMLTITGPGPVWTSSEPTKNEGRWKPSPTEYASFAPRRGHALQGAGQPLPAVERAQPEGLAAAAVAEVGQDLDPGLPAHLPRARQRRRAGRQGRRPGLGDRHR